MGVCVIYFIASRMSSVLYVFLFSDFCSFLAMSDLRENYSPAPLPKFVPVAPWFTALKAAGR